MPVMEEALPPAGKLYNARAIAVCALVGGPLGGAYLLAKNYISIGEEEAGRKALWWGIAATVSFMLIMFLLPQYTNVLPKYLIPVLEAGLFYGLTQRLQGAFLQEHSRLQGAFRSRWRAAGVGLISAVSTIVLAVALWPFLPEEQPAMVKFGQAGHEIYYDEATVTAEQAKKVAYFLADHDFFGQYVRKQVRVEQSKWAYKVLIPATPDDFNSSSIIGYYRLVQQDLDAGHFEKPVKLVLFYQPEGQERQIKNIE